MKTAVTGAGSESPRADGGAPQVEVTRSGRRKKTAAWRLVDGRVLLKVPARMPGPEVERLVARVRQRARKQLERLELAETGADYELFRRAQSLAGRYLPEALPKLRSAAWSVQQSKRWGSCSGHSGDVRISDRLRPLPRFVVDHVLVHELAHLLEPNHSPRFYRLVAAYPLAERARGFLLAIDLGFSSTAYTYGS